MLAVGLGPRIHNEGPGEASTLDRAFLLRPEVMSSVASPLKMSRPNTEKVVGRMKCFSYWRPTRMATIGAMVDRWMEMWRIECNWKGRMVSRIVAEILG